MKRLLLSMCLIIFISFNPSWSQNKTSYDTLLPPDVLLYLECNADSENVPSFPVYEEAMSTFFDTLDDFLEWRILKSEWNALKEQLGTDNVSKEIIGKQWSLAVSNFDIQKFKIPSIIYMSHLDDPSKGYGILKNFIQQIPPIIDLMQFEEEEYRGYLIGYLFGPGRIPGMGLAFAYDDETLFVSTSKPFLMNTLDSITYHEESLADNETYQSVLSQLPSPRYRTLYLNPGKVTHNIKTFTQGLLDMMPPDQKKTDETQAESHDGSHTHENEESSNSIIEQLRKEFSANFEDASPVLNTVNSLLTFASRIPAIAVSTHYDKDGYCRVKSYIKINPSEEKTVWDTILQREKAVFPFEDYMLRQSGTVNSGNVFGPNDLWMILQSYLENIPEAKKEMDKGLGELEKEFGLSLEDDLLSWMGHQWCVLRPVMDLESVIPIVRGAFLLEVTDEEKARASMEKISSYIQKQIADLIDINKETYQGTEMVTYQSKLPVVPYNPSWCINDGVFILSTNASMLREMLDVKAGRRGGIDRNRYYKPLRDIFMQPANMVSFQDNESEFYAFREGARRIASLQNLTSGADREKIVPVMIMDRVAYFLSTLLVIKGTVKHRVLDPTEMVMQKHQFMRDLRIVPSPNSVFRFKVSLGLKDAIEQAALYLRTIGDHERAIRYFKILCEFYPKNEKYLRILTEMMEEHEGPKAALDVYNRALEQMPETALVIKREMLREDASFSDILPSVQSIASKTQRVDEKTVLLGIALGKREKGDTELALEIFEHIIEHFPDTETARIAQKEIMLLQDQMPENVLRAHYVDDRVEIDGSLLQDEWSNANEINLTPTFSNDQEITAKFLHDKDHLFISMRGLIDPKNPQMTIQFLTIPTRDYVHAKMFSSMIESTTGDVDVKQTIQQFTLDPWGLTLEKEQNKPTQKEIMDGEWPFSIKSDAKRWSVEMAIPLNQMIKDFPENTLWTVPINLMITQKANGSMNMESGAKESMLAESGYQESFGQLPLLHIQKPSE